MMIIHLEFGLLYLDLRVLVRYGLCFLFGDSSSHGKETPVMDLSQKLLQIFRTFEIVTIRIILMMNY